MNPHSLGKYRKTLFFTAGAMLLAAAGIVFYADHAVEESGVRVYSDIRDVKFREVGLLLGTRRDAKFGENRYYTNRIQAAAALYHAGKIRKILVSGDNGRLSYNEPRDMRESLIAAGVPRRDIVLDFAGFRTLDSVIRADKIFGVKKFTVISQPFHCKRALFLAGHNGIDAIGFAAPDVEHASYRFRNAVRETFARVLALADVALHRQPRHLGKPEPMEIDPS